VPGGRQPKTETRTRHVARGCLCLGEAASESAARAENLPPAPSSSVSAFECTESIELHGFGIAGVVRRASFVPRVPFVWRFESLMIFSAPSMMRSRSLLLVRGLSPPWCGADLREGGELSAEISRGDALLSMTLNRWRILRRAREVGTFRIFATTRISCANAKGTL
jgi:hypothetical protein